MCVSLLLRYNLLFTLLYLFILGPPKLFSKLEMMFIISRNIEEGGASSNEPLEDAYEMVLLYHLLSFV